MARGYRRRFRNYLLDKTLQLRYVGVVALLSAGISAVLGGLIYRQEARASAAILETMGSSELADYPPELKQQISEQLTSSDSGLVTLMVGVGLSLVLVLSLYLVVFTHKVAGPLHKVSTYFDRMRDGELGVVYALRKGDMLQSFYDKFQLMHDTVRQRYIDDNAALGRFLAACDAAGLSSEGELGHQLDELRAHKSMRDRALGS